MTSTVDDLPDHQIQQKIRQLDRAILQLRRRRDFLLWSLIQRTAPENTTTNAEEAHGNKT